MHTLTTKEIVSIPAGRILNTLIQEYVVNDHATRWSNSGQKEIPCHWFEEHPRTCAEDDGGYSSADGLPNFSGDISRAMNLVQIIKDKPLNTHVEPATSIFPAMKKRFWASFSSVPYESRTQYNCNVWVSAETLSLAICYAALICKSAH